MSDTVDMTLLSGLMQETAREVRLLRLQLDNLVSRAAGQDGRLTGIDARIGAMEQSIHDLIGEVSRGFGQQQQIMRVEKQIEGVDAVLSALREAAAENTRQLAEVIVLLRSHAPGTP